MENPQNWKGRELSPETVAKFAKIAENAGVEMPKTVVQSIWGKNELNGANVSETNNSVSLESQNQKPAVSVIEQPRFEDLDAQLSSSTNANKAIEVLKNAFFGTLDKVRSVFSGLLARNDDQGNASNRFAN